MNPRSTRADMIFVLCSVAAIMLISAGFIFGAVRAGMAITQEFQRPAASAVAQATPTVPVSLATSRDVR